MDLMAEEDLRGGNPGTGHSGPVMAAIFPPLIDICLIYIVRIRDLGEKCQVSSAKIVLFWLHNVFPVDFIHYMRNIGTDFNCCNIFLYECLLVFVLLFNYP